MSLKVQVNLLSGEVGNGEIDELPDVCPWCKRGMQPVIIGLYSAPGRPSFVDGIFAVVRCTINSCRSPFVAYYDRNVRYSQTYKRKKSYTPFFSEMTEFSAEVALISKQFIDIYHEAEMADVNGLSEICGCGYRKALEFLVKDYLLSHSRDEGEKETIKRELLSSSIRRLQDENIRVTSEKAAWLGNDETHYLRTWNDLDLGHLKDLIRLVVNWIENSERTAKYREIMDNKRAADPEQ